MWFCWIFHQLIRVHCALTVPKMVFRRQVWTWKGCLRVNVWLDWLIAATCVAPPHLSCITLFSTLNVHVWSWVSKCSYGFDGRWRCRRTVRLCILVRKAVKTQERCQATFTGFEYVQQKRRVLQCWEEILPTWCARVFLRKKMHQNKCLRKMLGMVSDIPELVWN